MKAAAGEVCIELWSDNTVVSQDLRRDWSENLERKCLREVLTQFYNIKSVYALKRARCCHNVSSICCLTWKNEIKK